jgi:predicted RNA-binding Zn-ribbon protein involved in translation (DUF1610 family)
MTPRDFSSSGSNLKRLRMADPSPQGPTSPIGQVTCPNCLVVMIRVSLGKPDESSHLRTATYRCSRCGTQTVRWIKE